MTVTHTEVCDECVKCVQGSVGGSEGDRRMNDSGLHTRLQRRASCVSAVIIAFFSVCVKVKTEPDYRAFCRAMGSVCACRGFPLNTGGGGIPGPRRWLLKPNLKEFAKYARGHISSSEQEDGEASMGRRRPD